VDPQPGTRLTPARPRWPLFAAASLSSGAALVVSVVLHLSLGLVLLLAAATASGAVAARAGRLSPGLRAQVAAQARRGVAIGLAATAAYDASRLLLTTALPLRVRPFETLYLFGHAILGAEAAPGAALAAGTAYHLLNGVAFSVAYCLVLGGRRWTYGVAWALALEAAMLAVYPGLLDLRGIRGEFTLVSMAGHLAFGTTLGVLGQRMPGLRPSSRSGG
jgi:hypothetical protein